MVSCCGFGSSLNFITVLIKLVLNYTLRYYLLQTIVNKVFVKYCGNIFKKKVLSRVRQHFLKLIKQNMEKTISKGAIKSINFYVCELF